MLLKRQPQREKATVFSSNTTHNCVFSVVTQSYSVLPVDRLLSWDCTGFICLAISIILDVRAAQVVGQFSPPHAIMDDLYDE
jgi:hypothetical protein